MTLTYFVKGRITVRLTSCFNGFDFMQCQNKIAEFHDKVGERFLVQLKDASSTYIYLGQKTYQENDLNPGHQIHSADGDHDEQDEADDAEQTQVVNPSGRQDGREAIDVADQHVEERFAKPDRLHGCKDN